MRNINKNKIKKQNILMKLLSLFVSVFTLFYWVITGMYQLIFKKKYKTIWKENKLKSFKDVKVLGMKVIHRSIMRILFSITQPPEFFDYTNIKLNNVLDLYNYQWAEIPFELRGKGLLALGSEKKKYKKSRYFNYSPINHIQKIAIKCKKCSTISIIGSGKYAGGSVFKRGPLKGYPRFPSCCLDCKKLEDANNLLMNFNPVESSEVLDLEEDSPSELNINNEIVGESSTPQINTNNCVICMDTNKPVLFAFIPCGHKCLCQTCKRKYDRTPTLKACPICRKEYLKIFKITES